MKNTVIAKRYAKALFAVGKEGNAFAEFSKTLEAMAELFVGMPEVADALTNPLYPVEAREKVMEHLLVSMQVSQVMGNFFKLLVQKKRANILPDIAAVFQAMVDADNNMCQGTVISAMELTPELRAKVRATLEKITGHQVVLTAQVDPSIIGGIVAKVGDLVLDGSIRSQLAGLKESIKGSV
ncbi:MAG: ATP synthase F1 subunit delta [Deltaproteobacteria bacterium RIFOXYD12_FULL_55_16]|nr:MAG: ATP synthase F1 subunit delta [Deltaproteobacteria bacterium RIFOXYD12_FULL_55_16]